VDVGEEISARVVVAPGSCLRRAGPGNRPGPLSHRVSEGTDRAAWKRADRALTRLQAEVDKQRVPETAVPLSRALDEWLRTVEIEESTRRSYIGYIERVIKPVLGSVSIAKLSARSIETLYAELRRCRTRCDGRPFIERHRVLGKHDCVASRCALHVCRPMAASTVRQIHSIISGTLSAAVRWDWIATNPARVAQRPRVRAPEPSPPSPAEAARLLAAAFAMDEDWGTLVWLVTTTGIRRGEVCALRWRDIDRDGETIEIRRNYVLHRGVGVEKDTKTHQMRRIALDSETVALLREQKARVAARAADLGSEFAGELYMFGGLKSPDHRTPYSPRAVSSRYRDRHPDAYSRTSPLLGDGTAHCGRRSEDRRREAGAWWRRLDDPSRLCRMGRFVGQDGGGVASDAPPWPTQGAKIRSAQLSRRLLDLTWLVLTSRPWRVWWGFKSVVGGVAHYPHACRSADHLQMARRSCGRRRGQLPPLFIARPSSADRSGPAAFVAAQPTEGRGQVWFGIRRGRPSK
jgi:integrase